MTNVLETAATWLGGQLKGFASVVGTYRRGSLSVSLIVTAYDYTYEVVDTEGFNITALSRDYIVHAADIVLGGVVVVPRAGDTITETIQGVARSFEVMPLGQLKEYEPLDASGVMIKIHTKRIA